MAREPEHLARLKKACPRSGCRSRNVKWRYYNNGKLTQPRYLCQSCGEYFTFGGKVRLSKKEKAQAAARIEAQAEAAAARLAVVKKARTKTTPARGSSSAAPRAVMDSSPKSLRISTQKDKSTSPISKPEGNITGSFRLRLANGRVIDLPRTPLADEKSEDDDADAESSAATEGEDLMFSEYFEDIVGDVGASGSGAGAPDDQLEAEDDGGPAFSWTSSEQLRGPIVRCVGPSEPELLDSEKESLLIDTGLPTLRSWEDVYM